jgi:hypothetical protein
MFHSDCFDRVSLQPRRIVGVRIAAGKAMDALPHQLDQAMFVLGEFRFQPVRG